MSPVNIIFLIHIFILHSGVCLHPNQNRDFSLLENEVLMLTKITRSYFTLKWYNSKANFVGSGPFLVTITESMHCTVKESTCDENSLCTFDGQKNPDCGFTTISEPCKEVSVTVSRHNSSFAISFNLAPNIDTGPTFNIDKREVTLSWNGPGSSDHTKCATKAKVSLKFGDDWMEDKVIDSNYSYTWNMEKCDRGNLVGRIVYLTQVDGDDTDRTFDTKGYYTGVGVTTVKVESPSQSCSITATWEVDCDKAQHYKVTCDEDQRNIDGKNNTEDFTGLNEGKYKVSVQAYWSEGEDDSMGKSITSVEEEVVLTAPTDPVLNDLGDNDSPPWKLSVSWDSPTPDNCTGDITSYSIEYRKTTGSSNITGPNNDGKLSCELTDLDVCTYYTVFVAAESTGGTGLSGSNSGKTGSLAPGAPTVIEGNTTTSSISLSWNVSDTTNSCPLSGHTVTWTPGDGDGDGTHGLGGGATSDTITGLTCNNDYTVTVTATAKGGKNSSNNITLTTKDEVPGATIVDPLSTGSDNNELKVEWTGPDYSCTGGLGEYDVTWEDVADIQPSGNKTIAGTDTTIDGLIHCTTYTVSVTANSNTSEPGAPGTKKGTTTADAPGMPVITKETTNTEDIELTWEGTAADSCPLAGYTVNWSPNNVDGIGEHDAQFNTSYTITNLICNKDYNITIITRADDEQINSSGKIITTNDKAPGLPIVTKVSAVNDNPKQLTATWSEPDYDCNGALGNYTVSWTVDGEVDPTGSQTESKLSTTIDNLVPCTPYTISVEARSNTGILGDPVTSTATETSVEVPGISSNISKESSYTPYSLDVNWKEPPISSPDGNPCTITNYTVEWSSSSIGGSESGVTSRPYTIQDLNACTDYNITVIAYTDKGPGEASVSKLTTDADVPGLITDLTNTSVTANSLEVTWSPPVDSRNPCKIIKYTVKWVSSSGDSGQDETVNELSYNITGLIPCTDYAITVIAYTEEGGGNSSKAVTFTTDTDVPGISTDIKRKSYTPESLEVTWSPPPTSPSEGGNPCDITNYTVQWSNSSDGIHQGHSETTGVDRSYNITGLDACTDYYISIIAYTKTGFGETSEVYTNSTGVNAPKVAEDEVYIDYTSRDAQVTWLKPDTSCKLTYEVEHSGNTLWTNNQTSDPGKTQTIVDPIHNANLEELLPYSKYDVCVTVNNNINGENTSKTFTTEEAVSSEPRNVSVEDVDDVSLTLTWEFPAAENGILLNYIVSWGVDGETTTNHTVDADITYHSIYELEEGKYFFSVRAVNSKGSSGESIYIEQEMNGPTVCGGGCIAGIVIGLLLVALAIPAFIFRDRIMQTIKPGPPPVEESPYELRGAAILKSDFRRHVEELGLDRAERAYQMLNDESQQKTKFAASKPFNKGKNRFANIHPFDETRVKLQLMRNGPKGSDYINANHITFPDTFTLQFTATQGPLDSTINDFWRMIWEHKVYDTVMLCNLFEKGKSKCAQYWTENGERSMEFGDFKISCQAEEEDESKTFITRYIDVVKDGQHRMVKQHHFLAWPDFGVPENEEGLLRFLASVKRNVNEHGTNVLTHCSAGVGRTGTFIALWVLTSLLEQNKSAKSIDVHQISLMMREGRSDMIQTKDQYLYLHKCLLKYMEDTGNSFPISNKDDEEPIYGNVNTGYQQ